MSDTVNHPKHYTQHPSGLEAIDLCEHLPFNTGNALKYIWRAGLKTASPVEDLKKALWYLEREQARWAMLTKVPHALEAYVEYTMYTQLLVRTLLSLIEKADHRSLLGRVCGVAMCEWHHLVCEEVAKLEAGAGG